MVIQNSFNKNESIPNDLLVDLANFIIENNMLAIIDPLHDILANNGKGFTIGAFLSFAFEQLIKSSSVEIIKFAIGILELLDIKSVEKFIPDIRDIIKTFAYYDEFSLNCIWWIRNWPDANNEIFKIAQNTDGWGRIHALREINKLSNEQQVWILNNAISNSVHPAYTAIDIYHKCNTLTRLEGNMDPDTLDSIVFLIASLLDQGPVQGIAALEADEPDLLFQLLFKQINIHKDMFTNYPDIVDLFLYFSDEDTTNIEYTQKLNQLLQSNNCKELVIKGMGTGQRSWIYVANHLNIPCKNIIYDLIEEDFDKNISLVDQLFKENVSPDHITKIIINHINLNNLYGKPTNKLALGKEDGFSSELPYIIQFYRPHPYEGIQLVKACLHSPFRNLRNAGIDVLNAWNETTSLDWDRIPEIKKQLNHLLTLPLDKKELSDINILLKT